METELPTGNGNNGLETVNFDKIINRSVQNLAQNTTPKRGRGRPPKPKPAPEPQLNNSGSDLSFDDDVKDVEVAEVIRPTEVEPLALELVKAPFDIVGLQTGIDVTPDDKEAKLPSYYLAKLIHSYLPDLELKDPRRFNLVAFVISSAILGIKKFRLFATKKRETYFPKNNNNGDAVNSEPGQETSPQVQKPLPTDSVSAASYLSNRS